MLGPRGSIPIALVFALACAEPDPPRPNVLLISIDALRQDHLSLYGYERETSPRLEELAAEALVFERAWTTAPWTLIAHMTMLTGLFARQHGVVADGTALAPSVPTLAERLLDVGYDTRAFYFEGWIHERFGHLRGFSEGAKHVRGDEVDRNLRAAFAARDAEGAEEPFFFFVHVWDVHCQNLGVAGRPLYDPPGEYAGLFLEDASARLDGILASDLWTGRHKYTPEEREALVALYDGSIRYVDDLVGGWIDLLRDGGMLDDTIVIVTADHGEGLGDRKVRLQGHGELWEDGLRVPLVVRLPGGRLGGTRRDDPASLVDLVPTVLELCDLPREPWLAGHSLVGALPADRVHLAEQEPGTVVYRSGWKLVDSTNTRMHPPRVYELSADRWEERPVTLADEPDAFAERRAELLSALGAMEERLAPVPGEAVEAAGATPEEIERLRGFGYFGEEEDEPEDGDG